MATIDELMTQIPIAQLAGQLGVSESEAEQAVRQALPALVGGLQANAADPAGAASLSQALSQHDGSLIDGRRRSRPGRHGRRREDRPEHLR